MLTELHPLTTNCDMQAPSTLSRTCAITGTNGYVGSRIRDFFQQQGWQVRELTRSPRSDAANQSVQFSLESGMSPAAIEGTDALIHCAYDFRPVRWRDIEAINVGGTARLLETARQAHVRRVILISTMSAFIGCRSKYGDAKLAMERLTLDMDGAVVRPGLVYGPRPGGMFGKLRGVVQKLPIIPLVGRGKQLQYLAHEDDLCRLLVRLAEMQQPTPRCPIIAANDQPFRFKEILRTIAAANQKKVLLLSVPWRILWGGLRIAEWLQLPIRFRSDSLVSLVNQDPQPDFSATRQVGIDFREFSASALAGS
jgi:nucleoside-diphosphate-sugar epimerase